MNLCCLKVVQSKQDGQEYVMKIKQKGTERGASPKPTHTRPATA